MTYSKPTKLFKLLSRSWVIMRAKEHFFLNIEQNHTLPATTKVFLTTVYTFSHFIS